MLPQGGGYFTNSTSELLITNEHKKEGHGTIKMGQYFHSVLISYIALPQRN